MQEEEYHDEDGMDIEEEPQNDDQEVKDKHQQTIDGLRNLAEQLKPRFQVDMKVIERTRDIVRRMETTRAAELERLANEEQESGSHLAHIHSSLATQQSHIRALNYQARMSSIQAEQLQLARESSKWQTEHTMASGELARSKERLRIAEGRDVEGAFDVGGEVMHLQLLKQAGFHLTQKDDLLIYSQKDVHVVHVDPSNPTFEETQEIWRLACASEQEEESRAQAGA